MVLPVAEFRLNRSLRKTLRRFLRTPGCEMRFDSAFRRSSWPAPARRATARTAPGSCRRWSTPMSPGTASARVHSVETWIDGELVGGLYGVAIGRMVFGESMFSHRTDASKIALAALVAACREHGVP
jgi:leucyl/phenylalanyl-tRNA--protein transferase